MRILVTGAAGFIGFHLCRRLLDDGYEVVGVDSLTDYYDVGLKRARLAMLTPMAKFVFIHQDISDARALHALIAVQRPARIYHLAAQAGVRFSLENPRTYLEMNVVGTFNIMEAARDIGVEHLVIASSSSVYGAGDGRAFAESECADRPLSFYAASKRSCELMSFAFSHAWSLPITAVRLFTVYGPWGRPDMAPSLFASAILRGDPLKLNNGGDMRRDFTYIDDAVEALVRLGETPPAPDDPTGDPWRVVNVGLGAPMNLLDLVGAIETGLARAARIESQPLPLGETLETYACVDQLIALTGYRPQTRLSDGVGRFCDWYQGYYCG